MLVTETYENLVKEPLVSGHQTVKFCQLSTNGSISEAKHLPCNAHLIETIQCHILLGCVYICCPLLYLRSLQAMTKCVYVLFEDSLFTLFFHHESEMQSKRAWLFQPHRFANHTQAVNKAVIQSIIWHYFYCITNS